MIQGQQGFSANWCFHQDPDDHVTIDQHNGDEAAMAYGRGFWETWQIQTEIQIKMKIQIQIMVMRRPMAYDRWFGETPLVWQTGATLAVGRMRILLQQFIMIILMLIRIILPTNVTYNLHLNFCFWKHVAILPKAWPPRFLSPPECCLSFFGMSLFLLNLSFCAILFWLCFPYPTFVQW